MPQTETGTPAVPNGAPNEDDLLLNDITEDPDEETPEEEEEEVRSPAEQSEEEDEEKPEVDEEDKEPPKTAFERPTVAELKAVYPDIFKKFPTLRESFFREIEFTQIFPTVADAREAVEENEGFSAMSDAALEGDPVPILDSLAKTDKKAFQLFAIQFLPVLYKTDQDTYRDVMTPVIENLFRSAYKSTDEATRAAAVTLSKFMFGEDGDDIAQGKKTGSRNTDLLKEQETLKANRAAENATAFRTAYGVVDNAIKVDLAALTMKAIDPNKTYSPFIRKQLAEQVSQRISKQLEADKGHMSVMAARWKRAKANGYTNEDKSKIVSTFLARAKSLVPGACEKVRSLASGRETRQTDRRPDRAPHTGRPVNGRPAALPGKADLRKMTDLQILDLE